jgi:hypothetical protein
VALWFWMRFWVYRAAKIYGLASVVIATYLILQKYCRVRGIEGEGATAVYARADRWLGPWVCGRLVLLPRRG